MGKRRHTPEQVINKLREAEVELAKGMKVAEVGIAEHTYHRWGKECKGLPLDQARRFAELERENVRLKKSVADLSWDNAILREAAQGNSSARRREGVRSSRCGTRSAATSSPSAGRAAYWGTYVRHRGGSAKLLATKPVS
jgi:putative transposase